jgi:hypothetical protein
MRKTTDLLLDKHFKSDLERQMAHGLLQQRIDLTDQKDAA